MIKTKNRASKFELKLRKYIEGLYYVVDKKVNEEGKVNEEENDFKIINLGKKNSNGSLTNDNIRSSIENLFNHSTVISDYTIYEFFEAIDDSLEKTELMEILTDSLSNIQVFKIDTNNDNNKIKIIIIGKTSRGNWIGIVTTE